MTTGSPIEIPWQVLTGYQCFGCSPANQKGLRLVFTVSAHGGIETQIAFDRAFESYPGVVHGGVAAAVCDEVMGNLLVLGTGRPMFTATLRTRYLSPLAVHTDYRCIATTTTEAVEVSSYRAQAEIVDTDGQVHVSATGTYQPATMDQSRKRMDLTDEDARLIERTLAIMRATDF